MCKQSSRKGFLELFKIQSTESSQELRESWIPGWIIGLVGHDHATLSIQINIFILGEDLEMKVRDVMDLNKLG